MKVAIVDPAAYSLTYDVPLCEALVRAGCEVTLYTTQFAHGDMPDPVGVEVVRWFYTRSPRRLPRRIARALQHPPDLLRLVRMLARTRPDVVHVQWTIADHFDAYAWGRLSRMGVSVVFTAHNAQERAESVPPRLLRRFDAVVAHTDGGAENVARAVGGRRTWQLPIGAFEAYARTADPPVAPVRLGDGPLAVHVGLLRPYKGVDILLRAWPAVRASLPDAQLLVAGRPMGVDLPEPPPPGVHYLPRFLTEAEYGWALRRADAACLPYRRIDMSGVAASALACGTPLVCSSVGGFCELQGRGAILVPPEDVDALAAALVAVLGDEALRGRLAAEARHAIAGHFSWDAIARDYVERYATLAAERRR